MDKWTAKEAAAEAVEAAKAARMAKEVEKEAVVAATEVRFRAGKGTDL
jgi:hypothetical protein